MSMKHLRTMHGKHDVSKKSDQKSVLLRFYSDSTPIPLRFYSDCCSVWVLYGRFVWVLYGFLVKFLLSSCKATAFAWVSCKGSDHLCHKGGSKRHKGFCPIKRKGRRICASRLATERRGGRDGCIISYLPFADKGVFVKTKSRNLQGRKLRP